LPAGVADARPGSGREAADVEPRLASVLSSWRATHENEGIR
jgi:hypothetical protein